MRNRLNRIHNDEYLGNFYPFPTKSFSAIEKEDQESVSRRDKQRIQAQKKNHSKSYDNRVTIDDERSKKILNNRLMEQDLAR